MQVARCRQAVALCATAVLLLVGCSDGESSAPSTTGPQVETTTIPPAEADKQRSQRVVLTAGDVPGFTQDPQRDENSAEWEAAVNACLNNDVLLTRVGEDNDPRGAKSAQFSKGELFTVASSATFGETEDEARNAMTALGATSFTGCFSDATAAELRRNTTLSTVSVTTAPLPALDVGDQSAGYRSTARVGAGGQAVTYYLDFTFIRSGRGVAVLSGNGFNTPFPDADRSRLATTLAGRMAA